MYLVTSELRKVTNQYQKIVIYGTGKVAKKIYNEMILDDMKPDYFVVTKKSGATIMCVDDVPVYEIEDRADDMMKKNVIILICVSDLYRYEVEGVLHFYNLDNYMPISIFCHGWLYDTAYGRLLRELNQSTNIKKTSEITLLNTQIGSDNLGDDIIMYYTRRALDPLLNGRQVYEVASHLKPSDRDIEHMLFSKAVVVCGTNFLKSNLENSNWIFDTRMIHLENFVLFAVGSGNFGDYSPYTSAIWNTLLHNDWMHSVRESDTYNELLRKWNVSNVINTGCVTLFGGKVDKICSKIPTRKANKVVLTVTGYKKDAELDLILFSLCEKLYDEIYFWPQGEGDLEWMSSIYDLTKVKIVERTLDAYNKVLAMDDLDYIGSRLHGGIHAMARGKRSLIIAIDNRAVAFHKDTNIPIIYRYQVKDFLCDRILSSWKTEIHLDHENINQWFVYTKNKLNE